MEKFRWFTTILILVSAAAGCSKLSDTSTKSQNNDLSVEEISAEPSSALKPSNQVMSDETILEHDNSSDDIDEEIIEAIDFDEEAAKTATQDAEVEDGAVKKLSD